METECSWDSVCWSPETSTKTWWWTRKWRHTFRDRNPIPNRNSKKSVMLSCLRPTSGITWICVVRSSSQCCKFWESVTVWKVTHLLSCTTCFWTLTRMYSETIDGLHESIRKKVRALFMTRWNTFHVPVHSTWFLMDQALCHMDHESVVKLELIQVIKDFFTVETANGTKVGRDWKVVKSENVVWQEVTTRKQHDLHDDHELHQPTGAFTEFSMEKSQQRWVKTYVEDIRIQVEGFWLTTWYGSPRSCVL